MWIRLNWMNDFLIIGKSLLDYTNFISPDEYRNNDKIILSIFSETKLLLWIDSKKAVIHIVVDWKI